jgi:phytoene synthase
MEQDLILIHTPATAREGLAALLTLDAQLAQIVQTTRQPMVGQMRYTWWHDALAALDEGPAPAQPVLRALAASVVPKTGAAPLAALVDGWEALLDDPVDEEALETHARARGAGLFALAATLLGAADPRVGDAGQGWALADLSRHLSDPRLAAAARERALTRLGSVGRGRWPAPLRPLAAMALLANLDLTRPDRPVGHPARAGRLLWLRLTGR